MATGARRPLIDGDVAVLLEEPFDPLVDRLEILGRVTAHLGTDEVDLVILNTAPTALVGRVLQSRRVIVDRDPPRRHLFESLALRQVLDSRVLEPRILSGGRGHR